MATVKGLAEYLGVEPIDLIDESEYSIAPSSSPSETAHASALCEWEIERPLTEVLSASNGIQHRVYRMRHSRIATKIGRGKRYDFAHLPDDEHERLKTHVLRHPIVCDAVAGSPAFPVNYSVYPDREPGVWWVIDEWVEGSTLSERLASCDLDDSQPPRLARLLAEALGLMHGAGIVCREFGPQRVLLDDEKGRVLLTDFELAKLTDGSPTVSENWPDDPYRAPEVGAGEATPAADVFSWGRVVTHLIVGSLPPCGEEAVRLGRRVPKGVRNLLVSCCSPLRDDRPQNMVEPLRVASEWEATRSGR